MTGRGVGTRLTEHKSCAKANHASSNFYGLYPSVDSSRSERLGKKGCFEDLLPVFAAGFDPKCSGAKSIGKDVNEGGILLLNACEKATIASSKQDGKMTDTEKFLSIVAYQFELGYDLAIAARDNVSESPGFESFLGVFGGREGL